MKLIALKDVCKINMGQSPNSSSYNDYGDGMPFFQGNAMNERYLLQECGVILQQK